MKYDFHVHSTCSDGKYTRLDLLKRLNDLKFKYVSFCDHNYISDDISLLNKKYEEKYFEKQNVNVVSGTEFDVEEFSRLHLLGYDIKNIEEVEKVLKIYEAENTEICKELVRKINLYYGFSIPMEELTKYTENGNITKNIIVQWLIDNGYASSVYEAGMKFTSEYSPCYVKRSRISINDAFNLIKDNDGLAVLAHPSSMKMSDFELDEFVKKLKNMGLDGIEIYNADKTTNSQCHFYNSLAEKYNLFTTSGSDFHNENETPVLGVDNEYSKEFVKVLKRRNN